MNDGECVAFLQWALPQMGRRWVGYRKVRRRVCRRIGRRVTELGYATLADYRRHLERTPGEWPTLDALVDVTISRFYRDRAVFDTLRDEVLPALVERSRAGRFGPVRVWSAGCANGEEPYTVAIMAELADERMGLEILATDVKATVLERADKARYPYSAVRDLPPEWREVAFHGVDDELVLRPRFRRPVTFVRHDIRDAPPVGPFDLILCRYQAFTYFDEAGQRATLRALAQVTRPGAVLVLGSRERLPDGEFGFAARSQRLGVFHRVEGEATGQVGRATPV